MHMKPLLKTLNNIYIILIFLLKYDLKKPNKL